MSYVIGYLPNLSKNKIMLRPSPVDSKQDASFQWLLWLEEREDTGASRNKEAKLSGKSTTTDRVSNKIEGFLTLKSIARDKLIVSHQT